MDSGQLAKGFPYGDIEYDVTQLEREGYTPKCAHDSNSPEFKEELQELKNKGIDFQLKDGKHHQKHIWWKKNNSDAA